MFGTMTPQQQVRRRLEDVLAGLGFSETYTPTLRPDDETPWKLPEPITVEMTALRTRLLPSLVEAARGNAEIGIEDIRLFEIARVFLEGGDLPDERVRLAGVFEGDFARAKGVVEAIYAALKGEPEFERASDPLFHPGKAAKTGAGTFGVLHPTLLEGTWSGFEFDLERLLEASRDPVAYDDVITYPPLHQDLAFSVPEEVSAGELVAAAHEAAGPELREMRAFDVYRGGQVGEGRKSVAFAVSFQSPERTLSDEDAAKLREKIVGALAKRFGAELRA
jgi:phenylalanyl-tRNA synthetase beta chain